MANIQDWDELPKWEDLSKDKDFKKLLNNCYPKLKCSLCRKQLAKGEQVYYYANQPRGKRVKCLNCDSGQKAVMSVWDII